MKKNLVIIGVFFISFLLFAKVNDTLNLFDENQKIELEKKIDEISKNRDINIYLNSFYEEEGLVVEQAEKLVILNLVKVSDQKFKIELKMTKDMELDDVQEEIDEVLNTNEKYLIDKKVAEYSIGVLEGIDSIISKIKIEEPIVVEEEVVEEKENKFLVVMGVVFFLIFALIIRILMVKYKKSFSEEIDIVSKKR